MSYLSFVLLLDLFIQVLSGFTSKIAVFPLDMPALISLCSPFQKECSESAFMVRCVSQVKVEGEYFKNYLKMLVYFALVVTESIA